MCARKVNRNSCVGFYEAAFSLWVSYCLLVCTIMSAVPFMVMNCSSSFSAEKAESSEIAVQQILACVAVHVRTQVRADRRKERSCYVLWCVLVASKH